MVRVDSGRLDRQTPFDVVPRERWPELVKVKGEQTRYQLETDCRGLIQRWEEAESHYEDLGYESAEAMVRDGFGLDLDTTRLAVEWLRKEDPKIAVPLSVALGKHGGDRRSKEVDQANNVSLKQHGNDKNYTLARLHRDRPDLAARVESGELSANAAAIEAGFRKKQTPLMRLQSAWKAADVDERQEFVSQLVLEEWISE